MCVRDDERLKLSGIAAIVLCLKKLIGRLLSQRQNRLDIFFQGPEAKKRHLVTQFRCTVPT